MNTQTQTNEAALDAYASAFGGIETQLERLRQWLDEHGNGNPDDVNWGHVGSVNHLLQLLSEAADFINAPGAEV